jgi:hypothetical protein
MTKHIELDCHFIRDKILSGDISIPFVKFGDHLAEMYTKSLCYNQLKFISSKLGLYDYMLQLKGVLEEFVRV